MIHVDPHPTRLERLFDQAVDRYALLAPGDAVLVGVSGGADSTALLHLLRARGERLGLRLGVGHLDHGLRPESPAEARAVECLAGELGVAVHCERADVRALQRQLGTSVEAAGREARYDFFRRTAERHGYTKVALGHHADDNAETLLLNLLRGSGRPGLGGIRAMRDGIYIRPLLRAFRSDIDAYLRGRGLRWVEDATNADESLRRNRIRHQLIPLLERDFQPAARAVLSRAAEVLAAEEAWIDELLQPIVERLLQERAPGRVALDAAALAELPVAVRRRVVRTALRPGAGRPAAHRLRPRRERSHRHGRPAPAGRRVRESHPAGDRHRAGRGHGPARTGRTRTGLRTPPGRVRDPGHPRNRRGDSARGSPAGRGRRAARRGPVHGSARRRDGAVPPHDPQPSTRGPVPSPGGGGIADAEEVFRGPQGRARGAPILPPAAER